MKTLTYILTVLLFVALIVPASAAPPVSTSRFPKPQGTVWAWDVTSSAWRALASTAGGLLSAVANPTWASADTPTYKTNLPLPKGVLFLWDTANNIWRSAACNASGQLALDLDVSLFVDTATVTWDTSEAGIVKATASGGITDHGLLDAPSLLDDDHTQYHTDARGDARYYTETEIGNGTVTPVFNTGAVLAKGSSATASVQDSDSLYTADALIANLQGKDSSGSGYTWVVGDADAINNDLTVRNAIQDDDIVFKVNGSTGGVAYEAARIHGEGASTLEVKVMEVTTQADFTGATVTGLGLENYFANGGDTAGAPRTLGNNDNFDLAFLVNGSPVFSLGTKETYVNSPANISEVPLSFPDGSLSSPGFFFAGNNRAGGYFVPGTYAFNLAADGVDRIRFNLATPYIGLYQNTVGIKYKQWQSANMMVLRASDLTTDNGNAYLMYDSTQTTYTTYRDVLMTGSKENNGGVAHNHLAYTNGANWAQKLHAYFRMNSTHTGILPGIGNQTCSIDGKKTHFIAVNDTAAYSETDNMIGLGTTMGTYIPYETGTTMDYSSGIIFETLRKETSDVQLECETKIYQGSDSGLVEIATVNTTEVTFSVPVESLGLSTPSLTHTAYDHENPDTHPGTPASGSVVNYWTVDNSSKHRFLVKFDSGTTAEIYAQP